MTKSAEAFRTISEVAEWLGVQTHVLRFWESKFSQVKPVKRAGGRRYYRPADMLLLGGIRKLLHDDGLTIKGVQKVLREQGVAHVADLSPSLDADVLGGLDMTPAVLQPATLSDLDARADAGVAAHDPPETAPVEDGPPEALDDPHAADAAREADDALAARAEAILDAPEAQTPPPVDKAIEARVERGAEAPGTPPEPAPPAEAAPPADAGLPSFLSGAAMTPEPASPADDADTRPPATELAAPADAPAKPQTAPEDVAASPAAAPDDAASPAASDATGLPSFLSAGATPKPAIPNVDAPDPPAEADISAGPGTLGHLLAAGAPDAATRAQMVPIAAQLTALRDRLAAAR